MDASDKPGGSDQRRLVQWNDAPGSERLMVAERAIALTGFPPPP
jgi:hypothetical protein